MSQLKWILFPFSLIYGIVTSFRNFLYNKGILNSYKSSLKTICIGNLQVGGTGKSPFTSYLYNKLNQDYQIFILSRGYGRKTKGLICADSNSNALSIGDEPFCYYKFLKCKNVIVSENRKKGLQYIENLNKSNCLVLLDDAYQHRKVELDIKIILTPFKSIYIHDKMLPMGHLREYPSNDNRADLIIISKCPEDISLEVKVEIINQLKPNENQNIFFTSIQYKVPQNFKGNLPFDKNKLKFGLSSIANNQNFKEYCLSLNPHTRFLEFSDHYNYNLKDLNNILKSVKNGDQILTTEKDAAKLFDTNLYNIIPENTVYILPIEIKMLFNEEKKFNDNLIKLLNQKN